MFAQEEARKLGDDLVDIDHLLLGLLRDPDTVACRVLAGRGVTYDDLREHVRRLATRPSGTGSGEIPFSAHFRQALELAWEEAQHLGDNGVETEHVLLGAVELGEGAAVRYLEERHLHPSRLRWRILRLRDSYLGRPQADTPTMDGYCRDLTEAIDAGLIQDPLVPREKELTRLMQGLGTYHKPYPLLVGESGVGKSALIRACVGHILAGQTYAQLLNNRVVELDFGRLLAETRGHDDLYDLFSRITMELSRTGDILLVIEDLHWLFGEEYDLRIIAMAQLLLPVLTTAQLRCIATTTPRGLEKLESREGLLRLFKAITIPEMSAEETRQALTAWKPPLEKYHGLAVAEEALEAAIALAKDYRPQGKWPEAALSLLDAACSAKVFRNLVVANRLREMERRLRQLREDREQSGQRLDYARLNHIKEQITDYETAIRNLTAASGNSIPRRRLTAEDVKIVLERNIQ